MNHENGFELNRMIPVLREGRRAKYVTAISVGRVCEMKEEEKKRKRAEEDAKKVVLATEVETIVDIDEDEIDQLVRDTQLDADLRIL